VEGVDDVAAVFRIRFHEGRIPRPQGERRHGIKITRVHLRNEAAYRALHQYCTARRQQLWPLPLHGGNSHVTQPLGWRLCLCLATPVYSQPWTSVAEMSNSSAGEKKGSGLASLICLISCWPQRQRGGEEEEEAREIAPRRIWRGGGLRKEA